MCTQQVNINTLKGELYMKTKLISVIILTAVLLSACIRAEAPSLLQKRFEPERYINTGFSMNTGDYEIEGNVMVSSYEDIIFTFTYPEALSYMTLRVSSEGYFADIGGSEDELSPEELPDNAPVKLFAESLKAVLFEKNEFTENKNGEYLTERVILGKTVTATFTAEDKIKEIACGEMIINFEVSKNTASVG